MLDNQIMNNQRYRQEQEQRDRQAVSTPRQHQQNTTPITH